MMAEVAIKHRGRAKPRGIDQQRVRVVLVDEHRTSRVSSAVRGQQPCKSWPSKRRATRPANWKPPAGQVDHRFLCPAWSQQRDQPVRGLMWCPVVAPRKPPQPPCSSQAATQPAASEPGPSTPPPAKRSKRTKAEPAAEPTQPTTGKGKAGKAKSAPQPGRWVDRDWNAALNMQCSGESRWCPLELCWWPDQGKLPAKGKEYPELGFKRLEEAADVSQQLWGTRKQLVVFFGNAGIGTRGGWGAKAVLQACRKVVERPNSGKPTDRVPGKVVTVDEFRTSRVSSAMHSPQPCEAGLGRSKPTRHDDWKPEPGQVQHRLLRSAWSKRLEAPVRGLMWCPELDQATPGDLGIWVDRDCNTALNLQRAGESKWRPLELCRWKDRGTARAEGKEHPGLGSKKLRDRAPAADRAPSPAACCTDLTLVTDLAAPTASSASAFLRPSRLSGTGPPSITYINVTLRLPSSCVSLGLYTNLLCRGTVNSSLVINRWGVLIHTWSSAAVSARNLNLTCGGPLPRTLCSSTSVSQPRELLAALISTTVMAAGTTSFIHVLNNISLQVCGWRLVNITNKVIIAVLPTSSLQLSNLTLANLPVGPSASTPLSFFTAAAFIAAFNRDALGISGFRLVLQDVTLLLPSDEVTDASNVSITVQHLMPAKGTYVWRNTQLVSVQQQPPSTPLLVHDTEHLATPVRKLEVEPASTRRWQQLRLRRPGFILLKDPEPLPPPSKEYQQRYKLVNDRLSKGRQRLRGAAEYRRSKDDWARNNLYFGQTNKTHSTRNNMSACGGLASLLCHPQLSLQLQCLDLTGSTILQPQRPEQPAAVTLSSLDAWMLAALDSALRLNGLGPAVFFMYANVRPYAWVKRSSLLISPFDIPSDRRVLTLISSSTVDMSNSMALQRDTVITGDPHRPQVILLDLAAAPSRLGLSGPGSQLTLSNLVLGNAAPLLSSLVCGAAARQQGVACHPTSLDNMTDPTASSRAVWRATGLADLGDEAPLPPLCSPALAEALGGLTSLLWFFSTPRASDLADLPAPIASAPLVLLNVTILLPDLEAQAIREVAVGGSTRVNLQPDTLDLLRSQLAGQQVELGREWRLAGLGGAGQGGYGWSWGNGRPGPIVPCLEIPILLLPQVLPAAWPPGGLTFPTFSWFGIRGLHVTLAPATPTDPWGTPWADLWNDPLPQLVPSNLTTMVQPDGPLLLTPPDPPSPSPDPPSPSPGFASDERPSPSLASSSPSPGLPAPRFSLKPSPPAHLPGPSTAPFSPEKYVPSACSDCEDTAIGVAVGSTIACLLLCCVVLLLVARWRQGLSSPAQSGCGKAGVALSLSSVEAQAIHEKVTNPAAALQDERTRQEAGIGLLSDLGYQQAPGQSQEQQQEEAPPTQISSSCVVQAGSSSSGAPDSHGTSSFSTAGHAAAVPASSAPEAGPAAGPANQEQLRNIEACPMLSTPYTGASTELEQAGLEQELTLEQQLGVGAFGTVYRGSWRGMPVAVKRLLFSGLADQLDFTAQRQQVLMEAELNAGLAHPNLVATYAYRFAPVTTSSQVTKEDTKKRRLVDPSAHGRLVDPLPSAATQPAATIAWRNPGL
ncbi:hypothetical protein QJQ45_013453 [Haematococcus lacustris]|nr:hypothetical protein QJQ45_013453 [Haematococcus lacustris]